MKKKSNLLIRNNSFNTKTTVKFGFVNNKNSFPPTNIVNVALINGIFQSKK